MKNHFRTTKLIHFFGFAKFPRNFFSKNIILTLFRRHIRQASAKKNGGVNATPPFYIYYICIDD